MVQLSSNGDFHRWRYSAPPILDETIYGMWKPMYAYYISTGRFFSHHSGTVLAVGYAGKGVHLNNPLSQEVQRQGPIPMGLYRALAPRKHPQLGPIAIPLEPSLSNQMYGRSGFYLHGDNRYGNQSASEGCIILPPQIRASIITGSFIAVFP